MIPLSLDFFALQENAENANDNTPLKQERKAFHNIVGDFFSHKIFDRYFLFRLKRAVVASFTRSWKLPLHDGVLRLVIEGVENEAIVRNTQLHVFTPYMLKNFFARRCRHSRKKGRE
jgi:hypothetical protein